MLLNLTSKRVPNNVVSGIVHIQMEGLPSLYVIMGDRDDIVPLQTVLDWFDAVPLSSDNGGKMLTVLKGAGHGFFHERIQGKRRRRLRLTICLSISIGAQRKTLNEFSLCMISLQRHKIFSLLALGFTLERQKDAALLLNLNIRDERPPISKHKSHNHRESNSKNNSLKMNLCNVFLTIRLYHSYLLLYIQLYVS